MSKERHRKEARDAAAAALGLLSVIFQAPGNAAGAIVSGRVLERGRNAPLIDVPVMPMPQFRPGPPIPRQPQTIVADENGKFVSVEVAPGRYQVNARKASLATLPEEQAGAW